MPKGKKKRAVKKRVSSSIIPDLKRVIKKAAKLKRGKKQERERVIDRRKGAFNISNKEANKPIRRKRRAGKYKGKTPHIYDIYFPGKPKTLDEIDNALSLQVPPLKELPKFRGQERTKVKLTVISRNKKRRSAVTYIYDVYEPFEINLAALDILYEIYLAPKRGQKGYLQKVREGSVEQIVVDFETSV